MIKKTFVKNGQLKSRNLSEEKKTTPSINIPLLSYRKSEQFNAADNFTEPGVVHGDP